MDSLPSEIVSEIAEYVCASDYPSGCRLARTCARHRDICERYLARDREVLRVMPELMATPKTARVVAEFGRALNALDATVCAILENHRRVGGMYSYLSVCIRQVAPVDEYGMLCRVHFTEASVGINDAAARKYHVNGYSVGTGAHVTDSDIRTHIYGPDAAHTAIVCANALRAIDIAIGSARDYFYGDGFGNVVWLTGRGFYRIEPITYVPHDPFAIPTVKSRRPGRRR